MNKQMKELRRLNNELDKELSPENDAVLTDIICYLRVANISEYNQEVIRQDLLEMVLSAQHRGEDISAVIGEDYKTFCDNIIASVPRLTFKDKLVELMDIVLLSTSILGLILIVTSKDTFQLVRDLLAGTPANYQISISVGALASFGLIIFTAIFVINYIGKTSFNPTKKGNLLKVLLIDALFTIILILFMWFGRNTLISVHIVLLGVIVAIIFVTHKLLERYSY
ncbi:hypothetical protein D3C77_373730 [compost metagenome]